MVTQCIKLTNYNNIIIDLARLILSTCMQAYKLLHYSSTNVTIIANIESSHQSLENARGLPWSCNHVY